MIRTLLLIGMLCLAQGVSAQTPVIVTQENAKFNAPGDQPSWGFMESGSMQLPTRGEDQVWDFSQTPESQGGYYTEYIAPDNPAFPTATVAYNAGYTLNQFQLTGRAFFESRPTGEYYIGNAYDEATFDMGIAQVDIPAQTNHMEEGSTKLKLPAMFGSNWTSVTRLPIVTQITASSFGLNKTPLTYMQIRTFHDSIVGSGTLKLPGGGTYNALLKKEVWVQVDSFYMGGEPAPTPLLTLFGVEQGSTSTAESYSFYTPGVATDIMYISVFDGGMSASYRNDLAVSHVDGEKEEAIATRLYPDPVTGEKASLEFEKSSEAAWHLAISNGLGQSIRTMSITNPAGPVRAEIELPGSTPKGIYYYELHDEKGVRKGMGKFVFAGE